MLFYTGEIVLEDVIRAIETRNAVPHAEPVSLSTGTAFLDRAHYLVARHYRRFAIGELSLDYVQIGAADPARAYPDEHFTGSWFGFRHLHKLER